MGRAEDDNYLALVYAVIRGCPTDVALRKFGIVAREGEGILDGKNQDDLCVQLGWSVDAG